ncbi:hypothetical protein GCM10027174_04310 [Salinifilum aidingensis]
MRPIVAAAGGLVLGYLAGLAARRNPRTTSASGPVCGCGHSLALHDLDRGLCHGSHDRGRVDVPCPCHRYLGPKPWEEFYEPRSTARSA